MRPGNPSVVHHALVSLVAGENDTPLLSVGNLGVLINYAPGMQPTDLREGRAIHVPAGSRLLVQMHYTPTGTLQQDRTRIGLKFADPADVSQQVLVARSPIR